MIVITTVMMVTKMNTRTADTLPPMIAGALEPTTHIAHEGSGTTENRNPAYTNEHIYSGYFSGGQVFVVFVVERQTTKFVPMQQCRIVPGCGLVYHNNEYFSTNWPKLHCSQKFYPPKNTRYTVYSVDIIGGGFIVNFTECG